MPHLAVLLWLFKFCWWEKNLGNWYQLHPTVLGTVIHDPQGSSSCRWLVGGSRSTKFTPLVGKSTWANYNDHSPPSCHLKWWFRTGSVPKIPLIQFRFRNYSGIILICSESIPYASTPPTPSRIAAKQRGEQYILGAAAAAAPSGQPLGPCGEWSCFKPMTHPWDWHIFPTFTIIYHKNQPNV